MEKHTKEQAGRKQDAFLERVREYMERERMAERGSRIVAGVSGGADSVCLLLALHALAADFDWSIAAVHINHGIREEAGEDAAYVENLCGRLGIPFYLKEAAVGELAGRWGCGEEEAGRRVRYEAFEEAAADFGADRIAVAHNRSDRAETLLFHLFRGTGLAGMASIRPVRGRIIRPLLNTGREEIEAWLEEKGISWCIDRSNETDTYTRNRIRRHILPYVEEEICAGARFHLAQEAELLARTADYVDRQAELACERCVSWKEGEAHISAERFRQEDELIRSHILKRVLSRLSGGGRDLGLVHVQYAEELFSMQGGRRIALPGRIEGFKSFGEVVLRRTEDGETEMSRAADRESAGFSEDGDGRSLSENEERGERRAGQAGAGGFFSGELTERLERDGVCSVSLPGQREAVLSLQKREKTFVIEQKTYTKWLDYDRIKCLAIRTRQPGDYLVINERLQKKSLKEYLIQERVPAYERDSLPLLADGSHILWVIGHRISSAVKVTEAARRVLRIDIRGGMEHG